MFGAKLNAYLIPDANQTSEKHITQTVAEIACITFYSNLFLDVKHYLEIDFGMLRCAVVTRRSKTAFPSLFDEKWAGLRRPCVGLEFRCTHIDCNRAGSNVPKHPRSA